MARRRKSNTAEKQKDSKSNGKERNSSIDTNTQLEGSEENDSSESNSNETKVLQPLDVEEDACPSNVNDEHSQDGMVSLDIQKMILGDESVQHGDEIVVSRQSGGDIMEEGVEEVVNDESGTVVELSGEEYVNAEDEEEELILMNDDNEDGEENQYVIVVNSDFEVTDDSTQEVVSIHNLADLQEGSCEIITVVRESDYDSSQESVDEMEVEECDNINAVIGTFDGIHSVKIQQYNSDDECSNHDESFESEEINVTVHETEVGCLNNITDVISQDTLGNSEAILDVPQCSNSSQVEHYSFDTKEHNTLGEFDKVGSTLLHEKEGKNIETCNTNESSIPLQVNNTQFSQVIDPSSDNEILHTNNYTASQPPAENIKVSDLETNIINKTLEDNEIHNKIKENKSQVTNYVPDDKVLSLHRRRVKSNRQSSKSTTNISCADAKDIQSKIEVAQSSRTPDSTEKGKTINESEKFSKLLTSKSDLSHVNFDSEARYTTNKTSSTSSENLQDQSVTSNSTIVENKPMDLVIQEAKKEHNDNFTKSKLQSSSKVECKLEAIKKEVTMKDEESAFRSRSGSTETSGSESGSSSSVGKRRSGRNRTVSSGKHNESDASKLGHSASGVVVTSTTTTAPPVPGYELDKPVKVKSRWRRSSELEMGSNNKRQQELDVVGVNSRLQDSSKMSHAHPPSSRPNKSSSPSVQNVKPTSSLTAAPVKPSSPPPAQPSQPPCTLPSTQTTNKEVEDVLATFQKLDCNEYLTDRSRSKDKRMVCDCTLTKEEIARGDMGCGEDCLNRLLMIECGTRCMLGDRCANKRFQNLEYAKCEAFKTELKGFGLRALEDIPEDTFLLEYVGEVLDPKEFRKRAKEYSKDKNLHFYFMALKNDAIIDATSKGNISRFINHSCDPNAETQKWTVNGELRIGFFSKRPIAAGEEITFDYQLQRYGKEAQRCYCKTEVCRGWIGEDPEKENKWSDLSGRGKERRERKKKEDKRNAKELLEDIDLEEEIEKLVLKNRAQTLMLCRLMVRAEDHSSRIQLLRILQKGETACLRLFLDYHGLRLIWSWMMDPASLSGLKIEVLETLAKLPIPNKTMLQDSKVLSVVEKWTTAALTVAEAKDRSSTEDESEKPDVEKQNKISDSEKNSDDSNASRTTETEEQQEINKNKIIQLSNSLLKDWASLKEVFRIPKKERIEQMKEHEREADKSCKENSIDRQQDKSYDRHWSQDKHRNDNERRDKDRDRDRERDRDKERDRDRDRDRDRKRGRDSPDSDRSRKASRLDDKQKMERRQLFAMKAAQEEEERLRQKQENIWQEQVQLAAQELAAQQAAAQEALTFTAYPHPPQQWLPFPPPDPSMIPPPHMDSQQLFRPMNPNNPPPPFHFNQPPHLQHPPFLDTNHNSPFHNPGPPIFNHPPPLPKQALLPTPNQPLLPTPPLPHQPLLPTPNQSLLPTPPLPNQPFLANPQNQPLLPNSSLINPSIPRFTPQPPLPSQPPPTGINQPPPMGINQPHLLSIALPPPIPAINQPPPIPIKQPAVSQPPPLNSIPFPHDSNTAHFQSVPQTQFAQPPPFNGQPPLPTVPPTPEKPPAVLQSQPQFPPLPQVPVTSTIPSMPVYLPTPVRLPPKWKSAKDAAGRVYYYHVKTRISQWAPPLLEYQQQQQQQQAVVQESESGSESSDSDEEDSSSDEEEQEEEKQMEEDEQPAETVTEDLGCEELGDDSPYEPETMELLENIIIEDTRKPRRDNLVQERIISPRTAEEMPEKLDKNKIRALKEKLRAQKAKEKLRLKQKNKSKGRSGTSKCEADTSSDPDRKIRDAFRLNMAGVIVHYLNAYRKPDCKIGKITNTEDFKHLARKLTHFVMLKELKHCRNVHELECNDSVKHKARDFVKKYMAKFGSTYQRPADDD